MTNDPATALHNEHAPKVLRLLVQPQVEKRAEMSDTLVMTETVLFGLLLLVQREGYSPAHVLDALYAGVQRRLERCPPLFDQKGRRQ